jgi:uncharacterized membrane protein YfcA
MYELPILAAIAGTFLIAGLVKGVIGLGLPSITLGILTVVLDLPSAMALLLVPSFVTNLWQGATGGNGAIIIKRLWLFLTLATLCVMLGAWAWAHVELTSLSALLGLLLGAYGLMSLLGVRFSVDPLKERWLGPVLGVVNGILTGLTGSFVVPGVLFLQGIGLPRDVLVQAMGILFTLSTLALALALGGHGMLTIDHGALSVAGVVPALLGMVVGQRIRQRLSEQLFRRVFFGALLLLGIYIVTNAVLA